VRIVGFEVREAIAISMAAFIATGLIAVWLFWRGETDIGARWPAVAATIPGAFLGAFTLWMIPGALAAAVLAIFLIATGLRILVATADREKPRMQASGLADSGAGVVTGFFSALTGTGGPMVMVPLLVWRGTPLLAAIALGQVVQLPVASVATLTNYAAGGVDLPIAAALAVPLVPGVIAGRRMAQLLPLAALSRLVAIVLVGAGIWFGATQFL
jgi:uncharacterized membrane protein YfcA